MSGRIKRARAGQRHISARDWNRMAETIERLEQLFVHGVPGSLDFARNATLVKIKPPPSMSLQRYQIAEIDAPIYLPTDNNAEWRSVLPAFKTKKATLDANRGPLVVTLEPIPVNTIGVALLEGAVQCLVNVSDANHRFAGPQTAVGFEHQEFKSANHGPVRIIWKESGTGQKSAVVKLGESDLGTLFGTLNGDLLAGSSVGMSIFGDAGDTTQDETIYDSNPTFIGTSKKVPSGTAVAATWSYFHKRWQIIFSMVCPVNA